MQKGLSLLSSQMSVGIAENEPNGCEEITFTGTIAANDHIMFGRKRLDHCLILVATGTTGISNKIRIAPGCCATHHLKPWIIICLTYILTEHATRHFISLKASRGQSSVLISSAFLERYRQGGTIVRQTVPS